MFDSIKIKLVLKKLINKCVFTFFFVFSAFVRWSQIDSTLTNEEIQFRDSIAQINIAAEKQQLLQESFNSGAIFIKENNYSEAILDFSQVINEDSSYVEAYFNRAICYKELANYELAISDFQHTYRLDSTYTKAMFEEALVYMLKEDNLLAEEAFSYSFKNRPILCRCLLQAWCFKLSKRRV